MTTVKVSVGNFIQSSLDRNRKASSWGLWGLSVGPFKSRLSDALWLWAFICSAKQLCVTLHYMQTLFCCRCYIHMSPLSPDLATSHLFFTHEGNKTFWQAPLRVLVVYPHSRNSATSSNFPHKAIWCWFWCGPHDLWKLLAHQTWAQSLEAYCKHTVCFLDWCSLGLVVTSSFPAELQHIRNSLPDEVVVQRIDERLSALGNCIACNDYVALVHPDIDKVNLCATLWLSTQNLCKPVAHICQSTDTPERHQHKLQNTV